MQDTISWYPAKVVITIRLGHCATYWTWRPFVGIHFMPPKERGGTMTPVKQAPLSTI